MNLCGKAALGNDIYHFTSSSSQPTAEIYGDFDAYTPESHKYMDFGGIIIEFS